MSDTVLIVDDDPFVLGLLAHVGRNRGLDVTAVRTPEDAAVASGGRSFAVAVVDLRLGTSSGLDVIKRLRAGDVTTEAIVISADRRLSSAIESFEQDVFAFIPKPLDPAHLFATVDRALERRRSVRERHRLTWELGLLNEVSEIIASSLEIDDALQRALDRIAAAFSSQYALVRLRPVDGGPAVVRAAVGLDLGRAEALFVEQEGVWPSDHVLREHVTFRVGDARSDPSVGHLAPSLQWRSVIVAAIRAGESTLGAISIVSQDPHRFSEADERLMRTIGRQFGVAVANAQLYERVRRAKVEWERTFDAISDPIAIFDSGGRTMRTNAALAVLRGWPIKETQGRTCEDVGLCGGGCPRCIVGTALEDQQRSDREVTTADGRVFAVTTLPVPGATSAAVLFAKEVTAERERARQLRELSQELTVTNAELVSTLDRLRTTQAQLVQSEKLSAIGQLVAGVAHELNNPLTSIIGYGQLVQEEIAMHAELGPASQGLTEDVGRILSESERAARIVRNLLTFARRQTSERTRTDIADVCNRVIALRAYDLRIKNVEIALDCGPVVPPVFGDGGQLQQALLNLVLNAEQALRDASDRRLELKVSVEAACGTVLIEVCDNGHGIEPMNLQRVFDPFFTTRGVGEGTGLGLSIVYGIVRDHGGQIWVESEPFVRTSFFIRLPAQFDEAPPAARPLVLVAHADAVSRDFLAAVFGGWGYRVHATPNMREALERLAQDPVGLLVLDAALVEPDPARWREVWAGQREAIPLIGMTTATQDEETTRFLKDASRALVPPPFDVCQLRAATRAVLGESA